MREIKKPTKPNHWLPVYEINDNDIYNLKTRVATSQSNDNSIDIIDDWVSQLRKKK